MWTLWLQVHVQRRPTEAYRVQTLGAREDREEPALWPVWFCHKRKGRIKISIPHRLKLSYSFSARVRTLGAREERDEVTLRPTSVILKRTWSWGYIFYLSLSISFSYTLSIALRRLAVQVDATQVQLYYVSKKLWPILYFKLLYKVSLYFLDI